jgi:hypothetical protein
MHQEVAFETRKSNSTAASDSGWSRHFIAAASRNFVWRSLSTDRALYRRQVFGIPGEERTQADTTGHGFRRAQWCQGDGRGLSGWIGFARSGSGEPGERACGSGCRTEISDTYAAISTSDSTEILEQLGAIYVGTRPGFWLAHAPINHGTAISNPPLTPSDCS